MAIRVLLVDDHRIFREGLRSLLQGEHDLECVGEARDGLEAIARARETRPQVVIMDIRMPGLNGIDATRRLLRASPESKVIALSMLVDRRAVRGMLEAGASAFLAKDCALEDLLRAIRAVVRGESFLSPSVAGDLVDEYRRRLSAPAVEGDPVLSLREREVLQLLAEGQSPKEVALRLHLSVKTVESHRRKLQKKVGVKGFADLVKYAIREGLTSPE